MKVFLDTNVLVSAFATRGLCADLLRDVLSHHELVLGEVVLAETQRVLLSKLRVPGPLVEAFLAALRENEVVPRPTALPAVDVRDPDDVWVLASAMAASADVLVTGDRDLLTIAAEVQAPRIMAPREFWEWERQLPSSASR